MHQKQHDAAQIKVSLFHLLLFPSNCQEIPASAAFCLFTIQTIAQNPPCWQVSSHSFYVEKNFLRKYHVTYCIFFSYEL